MDTRTADGELASGTLPTGRWLLAVTLLVAEYFLAVFVFDSERLPPVARHIGAFALLGKSMPLIIVVMTSTLMVGGVPSEPERREIAAAFRERRRTWPLFAGHLVALALCVTIFVFNAGLELRYPWL
jgi:hypothetical protein